MTVIEKIAEYIVAESEQRQPTQVIHHAKRAFIDWFTAMYPGSIQDPNPLLRQAFLNKDDTQQAVIFPYGQRSSVKVAAFLMAQAPTHPNLMIFFATEDYIQVARLSPQRSHWANAKINQEVRS